MRRLHAVILLFALLASLVINQAPARADYAQCPTNYVCGWAEPNGTAGMIHYRAENNANCYNFAMGGSRNNMESLWNRETFTMQFWTGLNCSGTKYTVLGTGRVSNLGSFNNTFESTRRGS